VILLHVLSGKQAHQDFVVRRFPFTVGRGRADLVLDEPGVWDRHLHIDFNPATGIEFQAHSEALVLVNGEPAPQGVLRNGDVVTVGGTRLRMWLTPTEQKSLRLREALTWTALVALFPVQIALIYWLLR
jgi:hypothetical protein